MVLPPGENHGDHAVPQDRMLDDDKFNAYWTMRRKKRTWETAPRPPTRIEPGYL